MARNTFDVDETLEKEFNWSHYKRLGAYIKPYKKAVFKTLFVIILANLASMLGPYFTKIAIDQVIPQKNLSLLLILGAIFLGDYWLVYALSNICHHRNWTRYFKRYAFFNF